MLPRSIAVVLALFAALATTLARPAQAKDELVIGLTQYPSTWNPLIGAIAGQDRRTGHDGATLHRLRPGLEASLPAVHRRGYRIPAAASVGVCCGECVHPPTAISDIGIAPSTVCLMSLIIDGKPPWAFYLRK